MIRRLLSWLGKLWSRTALTPLEGPAPAAIGHNRRRQKKERPETFGAYYYLDNVLDDLTDYFDALSLLKKTDPDTFAVYSKAGAQVVSRHSGFYIDALPATWTTGGQRPAMGMVHITNDEYKDKKPRNDDDLFHSNFIAFQRFKRRPNIEAAAGDVYQVTVYARDYEWQKLKSKNLEKFRQAFIRKYGEAGKGAMICLTFHVAVDAAGKVRALREKTPPPPCGFHVDAHPFGLHRVSRTTIPVTRWQVPEYLRELAKKHKKTVDEVAAEILRIVAGGSEHSASGVQVRAKRSDGLCAMFNVDMLRTPYFFRDRDKTVMENGSVKRIFHITRAHARKLAGGRVRFVRSHFRGERKFTWNGYRVEITMPGLHHSIWQRFTAPSYDVSDAPDETLIYADDLGTIMDRHMTAADETRVA